MDTAVTPEDAKSARIAVLKEDESLHEPHLLVSNDEVAIPILRQGIFHL
jgi:hypothetical protein